MDALARSGELRPFRELTRPLEAQDRERGSDLIRTLSVYFAANANASEAADRLFLHRNSLRYRLERVKELTGLNLNDDRVRLALQLGLLAMQEERSTEDEDKHP